MISLLTSDRGIIISFIYNNIAVLYWLMVMGLKLLCNMMMMTLLEDDFFLS